MDRTLRWRGLTRSGTARYTPVTSTRSPGLAVSTRPSHAHIEQVCGVSPSGMCSGASWMRTICLSENLERLCTSCIACLAWHVLLMHTWGSAISPRLMKTS